MIYSLNHYGVKPMASPLFLTKNHGNFSTGLGLPKAGLCPGGLASVLSISSTADPPGPNPPDSQ